MIDAIRTTQTFFRSGGFVMWPLLLNGFFLWYFLILRSINITLCKKNIAHLLKSNSMNQLKKYRKIILTFATTAPLLGLLGTVNGMIETFRSIQFMNFMSQDGGISAGISEALTTTQMGLAIAVPAIIISRFQDSRARSAELLTKEPEAQNE